MAYDEGLEERLRDFFHDRDNVSEHDVNVKKMFGGLCFMVSGHMCCGIVDDKLMARVGPDNYENCLSKKHARKMDFTGKPMKGLVYVEPDGIAEDEDLTYWLNVCLGFIQSLPPKKK